MTTDVSGSFQVGDTRRPYLDINPYDANTVPKLEVVSPAGVASVIALSGPVVQPGGAGRWTATSSYTLSLAGDWYERWSATNSVSGVGAGAGPWLRLTVEATPPPAVPLAPAAWATSADYASIIGGTPPVNLDFKLWRATLQLRRELGGLYDPAATAVTTAKKIAACLQVAYAVENGWTSGAPTLVRAGQIGSLKIDVGKRSDGGQGPVSTISPDALSVLDEAGLTSPVVATDAGWPW